ncbi:MAG: endo-1,4-beta-xylanase [Treponema sp.]|jgi:GH35 family endo-1,4-beta-xylanase|nr:endo-1,4-beta-xylanase [Treponema sp.]
MSTDKFACRKSAARLRVTRTGGVPLANAEVTISQRQHEFLFGCGGFDAVEYAGGSADSSPPDKQRLACLKERLDLIFSLCNYATLPFYWGRYELEEGRPDERRTLAAAAYFAERGIATKGHPLCWHTVCADWLMNYSNAEITAKQLNRIRREVTAFKGRIDKWDVINEVVIMPVFDKYDNAVSRICGELGRTGLVKAVFAAAKESNPAAALLINDFNLSANYAALVDDCLQAGVPIDTIGLQTHQHQGYMGLERLQEILDRFSRFGLPLHFTENTIVSGHLMPPDIVDLNDYQIPEWPSTAEGEERQARELTEMYEYLFAHPSVEAITNWDPSDGKWLGAPSGLLRKDNSPKPAYHALMSKIRGDWWTHNTLCTDENGEIDFEGFRGNYELECRGSKAAFTLAKDTGQITAKITG